jgi:hypothetical protein
MVALVPSGDVMSIVGSVTSGATQAMMMKPPPTAPKAPPNGVQPKPDGDGDADSSPFVSGGDSSGKLLDLSA